MDRNTLLAIALSIIVVMLYQTYTLDVREDALAEAAKAEQGLVSETAGAEAGVAGAEGLGAGADSNLANTRAAEPMGSPGNSVARREGRTPNVPARAAARVETWTLSNDVVVAKVSNDGALISGWALREYNERLPSGDIPIELVEASLPILKTDITGVSGASFENARFRFVEKTARHVVQEAESEAGVLTRTIRLDESGYGFDLELGFESRRVDPVDVSFEVQWPAMMTERQDFQQLALLAYGEEGGVSRTLVPGVGQPGFLGFGGSSDGIERIEDRAKWAGFDIQYFVGVVIDPEGRERLGVQFEQLEARESANTRATLPSVSIGSGGSAKESLRGFFGPKAPDALSAGGLGLEHTVDRGWSWLEPLTRFFEIALDWLYKFIPNYGIAIIVLTLLVRLVTAPLTVKQMRSAERMREVKPKMDALQSKYKDDRQKQSEELMKLYKEEGINPLSGCFPILLQMPVLIGLFYALRTSIGLRHAPFGLWITDLSQPATLFTIPGVDFPVRILPLIMGASMFVQQKMMPQAGMDPVQARMMLIMMPGMMLLISYTFPSGLVLYWTVSNLLGIAHQYWIRNKMQPANG
ncbi:MAG: membrane protein insertase YidC [Myxococcota bacterium]